MTRKAWMSTEVEVMAEEAVRILLFAHEPLAVELAVVRVSDLTCVALPVRFGLSAAGMVDDAVAMGSGDWSLS